MSLFSLADLKRLDPAGTGSISDRHRKLFPGTGTAYDREAAFLRSRGMASKGTLGDQCRAFFSTPPGTRRSASIRALSSMNIAAHINPPPPGSVRRGSHRQGK